MLDIRRFVCNMFQENCFVVSDETKECVIIDCGAFYEEEKNAIKEYVKEKGLVPKRLLCTHGHIDHNFGNKFVFDEFGLRPEVCYKDEPLMGKLGEQAKAFVGVTCDYEFPHVGRYMADGENVTFGKHTFKTINTPGHTPGSVFFYCEDESLAFSGDTLFQMSIGRTDLELGSFDEIRNSLKLITNILPAETVVIPGHGGNTTMKDEMEYNPFIKTAGKWE